MTHKKEPGDLKFKEKAPNNILIVKIGAIGDVVMSMYLLTYIKKKWPKCKITWVAGKTVAPLISMTGLVDKILIVDEANLFKGSIYTKIKELFSIQFRLFSRSFDHIITCHTDWRYKLIAMLAFGKSRKSCLRTFKIQIPALNKYHGHEYVRLAFGEDLPDLSNLELPQLKLDPYPLLPSKRKKIILAPGGAKNILSDDALRRWPVEHYMELAKGLAKYSIDLILIGSFSDEWILPYFQDINLINMVGKLSLEDLLRVLASADLLITHDSGPMHLAKLSRCKILALFGPIDPNSRVIASDNIKVLCKSHDLKCSPCYDGKDYAKCYNNQCMKLITPTEVLNKALKYIG